MTPKDHSTTASAKFLGTTTALAAVTASSQGALVQITLTGNQISLGGNTLNADLTGDAVNDLTLSGNQFAFPPVISYSTFTSIIPIGTSTTPGGAMFPISSTFTSTFTIGGASGSYGVTAQLNGQGALANMVVSTFGAPILTSSFAPGTGLREGGITLTFSDVRIQGGAPTQAFLEVIADGRAPQITLSRLVFDDGTGIPGIADEANVLGQGAFTEFTPIPEPSGLALLALGAGGITFRRQRRKSA